MGLSQQVRGKEQQIPLLEIISASPCLSISKCTLGEFHKMHCACDMENLLYELPVEFKIRAPSPWIGSKLMGTELTLNPLE